MSVCAAEAEGVDAGEHWAGGAREGLKLLNDAEVEGSEVDFWIGRDEVQGGRNGAVLEDKRDFNQAGDAGGGFEVADVGFD